MILAVCAVRDSAMQAFSRPFFVPTTAVATRSFTDEVNRSAPDNPMYAHPDDYELHLIAYFDEESGDFTEATDRRVLARGKDVKVS